MQRKNVQGISVMAADDDSGYVMSSPSTRLEKTTSTKRAASGTLEGQVLDENLSKRCLASVNYNQRPDTPKPPVSESPNQEILSNKCSSWDVCSSITELRTMDNAESPNHETPSDFLSSITSWDVCSPIIAIRTTDNAEPPNHETPSDSSSSIASWDICSPVIALRTTDNAEPPNHDTRSDSSSFITSWDICSPIITLRTTENAESLNHETSSDSSSFTTPWDVCPPIIALLTSASITQCSTHRMRGELLLTSPSSSLLETSTDRVSAILQLETRPITQEQLVNEVKGIYTGLVMVEMKCVEIDRQLAPTTKKLSNEQCQALIALHRTLLHEYHDFFLASQHPSSPLVLRRLATKFAMPARMWRCGIYSLLELLRHRLPDTIDHMLAFVYLAYSMMALFMESVPTFEETWIECLGDLARYRMAIEEDLQGRKIWSGVARMWYNRAADKSPNVGRIQHHLAVLARPNIVQQLFYYSKALTSVIPFPDTRESIMLLFNPFLEGFETVSQQYPLVESALVKASGILFTHGPISEYTSLMELLYAYLNSHIGRITAEFRVQGPEIASSLCAATFDFGNTRSFLTQCFHNQKDSKKAQLLACQSSDDQERLSLDENPRSKYMSMYTYWASLHHASKAIRANPHSAQYSSDRDALFSESNHAAAYACQSMGEITSVVLQRIGDENIMPYIHIILAYLLGLAFVPNALLYIEGCVPWESITDFLNNLGRLFKGTELSQQISGAAGQLPEDFTMRGLIWAQYYFPADFFGGRLVDEDERSVELPNHAAARAERCLWIGVQLASLGRWICYDTQRKWFYVTSFATSLESMRATTLELRSWKLSAERDLDSNEAKSGCRPGQV